MQVLRLVLWTPEVRTRQPSAGIQIRHVFFKLRALDFDQLARPAALVVVVDFAADANFDQRDAKIDGHPFSFRMDRIWLPAPRTRPLGAQGFRRGPFVPCPTTYSGPVSAPPYLPVRAVIARYRCQCRSIVNGPESEHWRGITMMHHRRVLGDIHDRFKTASNTMDSRKRN